MNLSPKGGTPLHIVGPNRVAYLEYLCSGNETARHAGQGGPVTLMMMSMDAKDAAIVRLYGTAQVVPVEDSELRDVLLASEGAGIDLPRRQVVDVMVESTQTSCGNGVPVYEFVGQRTRRQRGRRFKGR